MSCRFAFSLATGVLVASLVCPVVGSAEPVTRLDAAAAPTVQVAYRDDHRRHHHHHAAPAYDQGDGQQRDSLDPNIPAYGTGQDPRPNGGFSVSPTGFGNYTQGADGGFGGYPPGSDGAKELQENQTSKCSFAPETC